MNNYSSHLHYHLEIRAYLCVANSMQICRVYKFDFIYEIVHILPIYVNILFQIFTYSSHMTRNRPSEPDYHFAIREIYRPFYETTIIHKWIRYCYHVDVIVYTCFHGKGTV